MAVLKNYVEVRVQTSVDPGELLGLFDDPDLLGTWEDNGTLHLYWADEHWTPKTLEELQATLRGLEFTVTRVELQDRNATRSRSIQPVRIVKRVFIRHTCNSVAVPAGGI